MISRIRREYNMTIIIVSHNMDDVAELANHVLVMDKGHLVMDGSPEEVFARGSELQAMGLGLPSGTNFLNLLKKNGENISSNALTFDETLKLLLEKYKK